MKLKCVIFLYKNVHFYLQVDSLPWGSSINSLIRDLKSVWLKRKKGNSCTVTEIRDKIQTEASIIISLLTFRLLQEL